MDVTENRHPPTAPTATRVTADELRQFIERYDRLEQEKKDIGRTAEEVMAEAKGRGYDHQGDAQGHRAAQARARRHRRGRGGAGDGTRKRWGCAEAESARQSANWTIVDRPGRASHCDARPFPLLKPAEAWSRAITAGALLCGWASARLVRWSAGFCRSGPAVVSGAGNKAGRRQFMSHGPSLACGPETTSHAIHSW